MEIPSKLVNFDFFELLDYQEYFEQLTHFKNKLKRPWIYETYFKLVECLLNSKKVSFETEKISPEIITNLCISSKTFKCTNSRFNSILNKLIIQNINEINTKFLYILLCMSHLHLRFFENGQEAFNFLKNKYEKTKSQFSSDEKQLIEEIFNSKDVSSSKEQKIQTK